MVGSALVKHLRHEGYVNVIEVGRQECDLVNPASTRAFFEAIRQDSVFHAAARVYGIRGNMKNKASAFYDNVMINTNVVDAAQKVGVKKITVLSVSVRKSWPKSAQHS